MSAQQQELGRNEPPVAVVVGAVAVIAAAALMVIWGGWTTGISWDEPYHVQRLTNFITHGWYLIDDNLIGGQPHESVGDTYVYAPVAALVAHAANVLAGNEALGDVATTPSAIGVRHLVIAVIGMVGTLAAAGMTRLLTRSWRWALVTGALLSAMPGWTGHTMFNIKDVPVATGYTLASLGMMVLVHAQVAAPARRRTRVIGMVLACTGIVLAVGTRPGIWPGPAAAAGIVVLATVLRRQLRAAVMIGGTVVGAGLVSWAVLAVVYPKAFLHLAWILGSVSSSASYGGRGSPLYVPRTALIEIPTVTLMLVLFSFCVWWLAPKARGTDGHRVTLVAVVVSQTLVIPALATAAGSTFYDGLRQILFSYPTCAVLVTLILRAAVGKTSTAKPVTRRLLMVATLVAMLLPTVVQARLFPYNYAFTSELGAAAGLNSRGDYWRTSLRELAPQIPAGEHLVCTPVLGSDDTYLRFSPLTYPLAARANDCRRDAISPVAPYLSASDPSAYPLDSFLAVSSEFFGASGNCAVLDEVIRTPYFAPRRISEVSRCDLSLRPYPAGGVRLHGDDEEATTYLLGEWTSRHDRPGVSVIGETGSLGFVLPDATTSAAVTVVFETAGEGVAEVEVNGTVVVPRLVAPGDWRAAVPAAVTGALGDRRLVVSWKPDDPEWSLLAVSLEYSRR